MPYVRVFIDADDVLDDLDESELREALKRKSGKPVLANGDLTLEADELARVETLLVCGQRAAAVDALCALVEPTLGRRLRA